MNSATLKILSNEANSYIGKIQKNLLTSGTEATGKTGKSLRYEITENGTKIILEVFGKPYFAVVETGRKPTPNKGPSRAMIENIKEWTSAKGLPESAVWGIAWGINNHGSALWRKGGRKDIYSNLGESFSDKIFMEVSENIASEYFRKVNVAFTQ